MFNNINIEEDTRYEVLITTSGNDNSHNTKPFGVVFKGNIVKLNLYPNTTLKNIRDNPSFIIQITSNPLIFTKALLNKLDASDYNDEGILNGASYALYANTIDYMGVIQEDNYGKTQITKINAEVTDVIKLNNSPSIINRTTNKIIELLVKLSRLPYLSKDEVSSFKKEVDNSLKFIVKEGNQNHIDSLTLIKQELNNKKQY